METIWRDTGGVRDPNPKQNKLVPCTIINPKISKSQSQFSVGNYENNLLQVLTSLTKNVFISTKFLDLTKQTNKQKKP